MRKLLTVWIVLAAIVGGGATALAQGGMFPGPGTVHSTGGGGGGPTFDATASSSSPGLAGTTLTWSHTNSGNAMCVGIYTYGGGGVTVSNVKYAGSANFAKKTNTGLIGIGTNTEIHCSDGITLATGANNVVITMSGTGGVLIAYSISVTGGNATTPLSNFNSTTGTSAAPSITATSATGQLIFDIAGNDSNDASMTPNGAQTQRLAPTNAPSLYGAGSTKPGAASTTMSWTLGASEAWAQSYGSFQ
jgi:hypothetical protein